MPLALLLLGLFIGTSLSLSVQTIVPISVNYHFTRKCNYSCGFCFHTSQTSHVESLEQSKRILRLLRDEGCEKINFAGGEPFLPEYREKLGEMVKYAKEDCGYPSVSIISNAVYVNDSWFARYSRYLDILGISCDSSDEVINKRIGRGSGDHVPHVLRAAALCHRYGVKLKLNTVVNRYNWHSDMSGLVNEVNPMRWKVFQVLDVSGENSGPASLRDVSGFLITSREFNHFTAAHRGKLLHPLILKEEPNHVMQASYFLVDEYGRFLDLSLGGKQPTASLLQVGVAQALQQLLASAGGGFDPQAFAQREGIFDWTKPEPSPMSQE
jgi:radical S-adenosyl methionine domain-containing protein 2